MRFTFSCRKLVIESLGSISEPGIVFQREANPQDPNQFQIGNAFETLVEDCWFLDDPKDWIGRYLRDDEEFEALLRVHEVIDEILELAATDWHEPGFAVAVMATPSWPALVQASREALDIMLRNDAIDPPTYPWDPCDGYPAPSFS